jgi:exosortase A-associated hydrolase 1
MRFDERALSFRCRNDWLYGILSQPAVPHTRGILIVVGGPQYRVGSHRQFTLLTRYLAGHGIAALRFDYRGMGDSEGEARDFEAIEDDIGAAIDAFMEAMPGVREVVLWGLCDAASAVTMYAPRDPRVCGLVLLNPWVRTADGIARTMLKHHYRDRLRERDFWRKLVSAQFDYARSFKSMIQLARLAFSGAKADEDALPARMYSGMRAFRGRVMLIIGGSDLTGREFCDVSSSAPAWKRLLDSPQVTWRRIEKADHTFSRRSWRDQVAEWTREWMQSW